MILIYFCSLDILVYLVAENITDIMNTIHLIESRKGNLYLFSYRGRSLSFVHPKMSHIIRQMFKDEYKTGKSRKYYERKVAYLKNMDYSIMKPLNIKL